MMTHIDGALLYENPDVKYTSTVTELRLGLVWAMQLHLNIVTPSVRLLCKLIFLSFCYWLLGLQQSLTFAHLILRESFCMLSPPRTHGSCWG